MAGDSCRAYLRPDRQVAEPDFLSQYRAAIAIASAYEAWDEQREHERKQCRLGNSSQDTMGTEA